MDFRGNDPRKPSRRRRPPAPAGPRRIVRCGTCGRSEVVSPEDLAGYMQCGWPRCCGGVMTYFLEGERPDATGDLPRSDVE